MKIGRIPGTLVDQIKLALQHLHTNAFVFGDLRPSNVMITKNEAVKLIDFDWAGIHQVSWYPLLMSPLLRWPAGVEGLTIMDTGHDDDMLTRLLD
jgi:serine/threonine protein kinase